MPVNEANSNVSYRYQVPQPVEATNTGDPNNHLREQDFRTDEFGTKKNIQMSPWDKAGSHIYNPHNDPRYGHYFSREHVVYDPFTGEAYFYKNESDAKAKEEEIAVRRHEHIKLASADDPETVEQRNKSLRDTLERKGIDVTQYDAKAKSELKNAIEADKHDMPVSTLVALQGQYPDTDFGLSEVLATAYRHGLTADQAGSMTINELQELNKNKLKAPEFKAKTR